MRIVSLELYLRFVLSDFYLITSLHTHTHIYIYNTEIVLYRIHFLRFNGCDRIHFLRFNGCDLISLKSNGYKFIPN